MDSSPRTLTESLKKRAELALACAKKVAKVWVAYDPDDKGPQTLVKQGNAYLSGKLTAEKLYQVWKASDYMNKTEDERYSCAPMAAVAAERAAIVPYYDEFLLEPRYADADNTDLDPYDWDTAWCASIAWSGQDEEASPGQKRVEEMIDRSAEFFEALRDRGVEVQVTKITPFAARFDQLVCGVECEATMTYSTCNNG